MVKLFFLYESIITVIDMVFYPLVHATYDDFMIRGVQHHRKYSTLSVQEKTPILVLKGLGPKTPLLKVKNINELE